MQRKRILIAPLDWGLGHTTRILPIIGILLNKGHRVTVACNERQKALIIKDYPQIKFVHLDGYDVVYSLNTSMAWNMIRQSHKITKHIKRENKWLQAFIDDNPQDFIISDNRFGFYHPRVENVYITHQINIQGPAIIKPILFGVHKSYIDNFHHCWIPDTSDSLLAGDLSNTNIERFKYIGPVSRFKEPAKDTEIAFKYLGIASGPEPQKSAFCKLLENKFLETDEPCAIIGGEPLHKESNQNQNVTYFPHLSTPEFYDVVSKSEVIVSRSGYSTIMDFSILQKPIFFVPTPGQTEQEYLAKFHFEKSGIGYCKQKDFSLAMIKTANRLPQASSDQWRDRIWEVITLL